MSQHVTQRTLFTSWLAGDGVQSLNLQSSTYGKPSQSLPVIDWMIVRFTNGNFDDNLKFDLTMAGFSSSVIALGVTLAANAVDTLYVPFHSGLPLWRVENDVQGSSVPPQLLTNTCKLSLSPGNVSNTDATAEVSIGFHFETPALRR